MWYDLPADYSFSSQADFRQQPQIQASREQLLTWLKSLESETGIPLSQTILAGFSQGGAMTLDVGLQLPLAAVMVLSGYAHAPIQIGTDIVPNVLMVHGRSDLVVPVQAAEQARDQLIQLGVPVQYHEISMGHEIDPVVLKLMQSFIEESVFSPDLP
jgi:phospholipase/carboxylesterase